MYTTVVRIDICSVSAVSKYREFIHSILLYICECGSLYVVYYIFEFACVSSLESKQLMPQRIDITRHFLNIFPFMITFKSYKTFQGFVWYDKQFFQTNYNYILENIKLNLKLYPL